MNEKYKELSELSFIVPILTSDLAASFRLVLMDINIRLIYAFASGRVYWYKVNEVPPSPEISFEEVLRLVPNDIKEKLLFNLDLFR